MLLLFALPSRAVGLQTLDLRTMTCGWDRPQIDRCISGTPLRLGGKTYAHGIGTHAVSALNLKLDEAESFDSVVGVDDDANGKGSVEFVVAVNGVTRWHSGKMRGGEAPKNVHVDLAGAKTLSLRVTDAGDGTYFDHADWADARVTTSGPAPIPMRDLRPIRIETSHAALNLFVDDDGHLFQRSFGSKTEDREDSALAYPASGDGWVYEPALGVTHSDGNTSTDLRVTGNKTDGNLTTIHLKDPEYSFTVDLFFQTFPEQDVIETWSQIRNEEPGVIHVDRFASASPDFGVGSFWLTQFHGEWANEANMSEERLTYGIKTIDSKLGVRAQQFRSPSFLLSKGGPLQEDSGEVFGGTLAWSGSFAFSFEVDPVGRVRALCGMNPYESTYHLDPGKTLETAKMIWSWSDSGAGKLSRNMHEWARQNAIRDGGKPRAILLNNWEATYFHFDEKKIVSLFGGAKELGMELFLLDDGWFGVKYPRDNDGQGLGDWTPDPKKLPNGLGALTKAAGERGLRFGIWLEPEMVNPKSELFEKHPDWVIRQPKRELELQRNQLILDLSRPEAREYAFQVADRTLTENPGISYVKWDCNRYVTQPGSPYLGHDRQSNLWIDYVKAVYDIFARVAKKHPNVEIMMCSGGGARVDYGAMKYAQEFWPSDMTDPAKRIFIQWGYSYFFPAIAMCDHVTDSGHRPWKFAFDVAMSGCLGMDVDLDAMSADDRKFAAVAIETYKQIRGTVQLGDQYRLESPYAGSRSALMYVRGKEAVVFAYSLGESPAAPLKLKGLDPAKTYAVHEIDLPVGVKGLHGSYTGAALMNDGLPLPKYGAYESGAFAVSEP
jgi:alpha-galactosidase